jgi:hypothetical protein
MKNKKNKILGTLLVVLPFVTFIAGLTGTMVQVAVLILFAVNIVAGIHLLRAK